MTDETIVLPLAKYLAMQAVIDAVRNEIEICGTTPPNSNCCGCAWENVCSAIDAYDAGKGGDDGTTTKR